MNILVDMWRYSEASSHEKTLGSLSFLGKITKNSHKECFSFVSEEETRVVFVFAGTRSNLVSWIKDFIAFPLSKDSLTNTKTNKPGIIHRGFYEIWEKSKPMVDEILKRSKDKEIFVTGMSQGGAVSTICARHLVKNRNVAKTNISLVTFGAPSQGTKEYASQVNELLQSHYRVVNGYDIVPTMPPKIAGFCHCGSFIWLKNPWWTRFFRKIKSHFYSSYTKSLIKKFTNQHFITEIEELEAILKRVVI